MTVETIYLSQPATCSGCGFTTADLPLLAKHSCDVAQSGGRCEDYPACGHENGDCNGLLYGSDEAIKAEVEKAWATGHGYCEHSAGLYNCGDDEEKCEVDYDLDVHNGHAWCWTHDQTEEECKNA